MVTVYCFNQNALLLYRMDGHGILMEYTHLINMRFYQIHVCSVTVSYSESFLMLYRPYGVCFKLLCALYFLCNMSLFYRIKHIMS